MPPIDAVLGEDGWEVQPIVNLTTPPATTWAKRALVSASFGTSRGLAFFTDLGEYGSLMQWTGARWRALNGTATLVSKAAAQAGITNSETVVLQALIPAGAWQVNDVLRVWIDSTKSGTTDAATLHVRIGTAGTTGDTSATGALTFLSAGSLTGGHQFDFKLASATSSQRVGVSGGSTAYAGPSANGIPAAVTITDSSANALYVTVTVASAGTTNTVAVTAGQIQLLTP